LYKLNNLQVKIIFSDRIFKMSRFISDNQNVVEVQDGGQEPVLPGVEKPEVNLWEIFH